MGDVQSKKIDAQVETLEVINAEIIDSLARQSESSARIDSKAVILVGYVAVVSSFLATHHAETILAICAYGAYALAAVFGIWAYAVSSHDDAPDPRKLFNGYMMRSKADTLAAVAATRVIIFERNAPKHKRKARAWQISLVALAIGTTLMLISIVVQTGHHGNSAGSEHRPGLSGANPAAGPLA
jgi:Ca2+/Na+ antiporter